MTRHRLLQVGGIGLAVLIGLGGWSLAAWRKSHEQSISQEALRKSEEKFRLLFERSGDAILLLDAAKFQFVDCNEATIKMLRATSKEQVCNLHPAEISPDIQPDGLTSYEKASEMMKILVREGTNRFEWMHKRMDGEEFLVEVLLTSVQFSDKPLIVTVWREIGERKAAEAEVRKLNQTLEARVQERTAELEKAQAALAESEQKFRLLFERTADAILLYDGVTMQFVDANDAAVSLFQADSRAQILAAHPWQVSPPTQPDGMASDERAALMTSEAVSRGVHRFEWMHRTLAGTDFPCEVTLTCIQLGDRPLMTAVLRDITERKRAEAELQRNLETERELSRLKSNFVSMVSHEFRTPLGVISVSSELLKLYGGRLDAEQRMEHIDNIIEATQRMSGMMENILVLSRVDTNRLECKPAPIHLPGFCARLIDEMQSVTSHRCDIRFIEGDGTDASAEADEGILRHILPNLLSNACKYSEAGSEIELKIVREGCNAIFTVTDHGIGISEEDQEKLFQSFHRGGNVGQISGTGLGLVIVKRCVDLHGGSIAVRSKPGSGSAFTVTLPLYS